MAALSERKMEIVRTLVEAAPDKVVGSLQQALSGTSEESALGGVRRLVEHEVADRTLRNIILQPIAPMCMGVGDDPRTLTFPSKALAHIWRALSSDEAERIAEVQGATEDGQPPAAILEQYDAIAAAAAEGLRERRPPHYAAAMEACDEAREDGAETLLACLELSPVVRRALQRLPEWLAHPGGETTAAARLAFKDVMRIAEDSGPLFFEMIAAHMGQPWMVLRVISAVMDKPNERYLADSELAGFAERLMGDIDAELLSVSRLDPDGGAPAGRAAGKLIELALHQIAELETSIDLQREHGWGLRVVKQRATLAGVVESRLRDAEKATVEALPMHIPRGIRSRRQTPRLGVPPEPRPVTRATTLLTFSDELRTTANYGGFGAARARLVESLSEYIDHYVEDVVDMIHNGEAESREIAAAYLDVAADLGQLVGGEKAGDLIRRRGHAVLHEDHGHEGPAKESHSRA